MTASLAPSDHYDRFIDGPEESDSAWSAWSRSVDHSSIGVCLILFGVGVILSFAASTVLAKNNGLEPFYYAWRHMAYGLPAFLALFALSFLEPRGVRRVGAIIAILSLAALALLPFYGVDFNKGAVRWFSLWGVSVQPSEFLKPGLIVLCAWMLSAMEHREQTVARIGALASFLTAVLAIILLILQPDYGQAALIAVIWGAMFFISGAPLPLLLSLFASAFGVGVAGYAVEPHVAARIEAFLDPSAEVGQQMQIAMEAIVKGGWTGLGPGAGIEKIQLPDAHTDFVIAVAAEEYGFGAAAAIIALFGVITLRALWRVRRASDPFVRLAGIGLALLIGLQAFVNLAVAVQLLPAKGMTLPFISYGGSSMVATGMAMGLLLALTRRRPGEFHSWFPRRA